MELFIEEWQFEFVNLYRQEMQGLFDPVVEKVIKLVESQAAEVKKMNRGKIHVSPQSLGLNDLLSLG